MVSKYANIIKDDVNLHTDESMVKNSGGGYSFKTDIFTQLKRFLVLGSEGGTYYITENKLTKDNCNTLKECFREDYKRTIDLIVDVSTNKIAPKNDPAIFSLAICFSESKTLDEKNYTISHGIKVIRTSTHLFQFIDSIKLLCGSIPRKVRLMVQDWYNNHNTLSLQLVKYKERCGWTHQNVLALCHCKPKSKKVDDLFAWVTGKKTFSHLKEPTEYNELPFVKDKLVNATTVNEVINLINTYRPTWEMVPRNWFQKETANVVWNSLLPNLPVTALIRSLVNLYNNNVLSNEPNINYVTKLLENSERIKGSGLHPIHVMNAYETFRKNMNSPHESYGKNILSSLDKTLELSFKNVPSIDKKILTAVDVSGSMTCGCSGYTTLTARTVSGIIALMLARSTNNNQICKGFSSNFMDLGIRKNSSMDDVIHNISNLPFDATDCSLPMVWAKNGHEYVDCFVILTDSETNYNKIDPHMALSLYRKSVNPNAKLIVASMVSNYHTVGDPQDAGTLNIVGVDSNILTLINNFILNVF